MQPAIKALNQALQDPLSEWSSLVTKCNTTAVLPIRDLSTGHVKKMWFASGTKSVNMSSIVVTKDSVLESTEANGDTWCNTLVCKIKEKFDVRIFFGGNAVRYGISTHNVANLALMSYQELIEDISFFHDDELFAQYISFTTDVHDLFDELFSI